MYILSEYAVCVVSVFFVAAALFSACAGAVAIKEGSHRLREAWGKVTSSAVQGLARPLVLAFRWAECAGAYLLFRKNPSPCWPKIAGRQLG